LYLKRKQLADLEQPIGGAEPSAGTFFCAAVAELRTGAEQRRAAAGARGQATLFR
jgi:hypothetical protein